MADKNSASTYSSQKKDNNVKQALSLQDVLDGILYSEFDEEDLYSSIDRESSIDGSDCDDLSDLN